MSPAASGGGNARLPPALPPARASFDIPLWNRHTGRCWLTSFDAAGFSLDAFARHRLPLPEAIARSRPKRQAEYFHGRMMAREALAALGLHQHEVSSGSMRQPLWPSGVVGSISHTRGLAAAIVLPDCQHGGIGIDLEDIADADACAAIMRTALSPDELEYLQSLARHVPLAWLLTAVFSAKESFYKAVYPSVMRLLEFSAVAVVRIEPAAGAMDLVLKESLAPGLASGTVCRVHVRSLAATTVCTSCSLAPGFTRQRQRRVPGNQSCSGAAVDGGAGERAPFITMASRV